MTIQEQAAKCPQEYGKAFALWSKHPEIQKLSEMIATAGYPHLAIAVTKGKKYVNSIASCPLAELDLQLRLSEQEASRNADNEPKARWQDALMIAIKAVQAFYAGKINVAGQIHEAGFFLIVCDEKHKIEADIDLSGIIKMK